MRARSWQKFCSATCRAVARNQGIRDRTLSLMGQRVLDAAMSWQAAQGREFAYAAATLWDACEKYRDELADREEP